MTEIHDPSPTVVRVLQFTDLHLFAEPGGRLYGVDTAATFRACLEHARSHHWPVDLVLLTGDLAHDPSPAAYDRLAELLGGLQVPIRMLPGNHDEAGLLRRLEEQRGAPRDPALDYGHWQVLLLDSTVPGSDAGRLAPGELARLDAALEQGGRRHTLVCMHHSPVALDTRWLDGMRLENAGALFARLDAHPETSGALLWGHVHQEYDAARGPWRLLATPSTCVQFAPGSDEFALDPRPPGYRWLNLYADGRIDTGVARLPRLPAGFDPAASGY